MDLFDPLNEHDYEKLVFCNDGASGLRGIIAIHDTTLGPALGGVRMRPYETEEDALVDVLRLARGMTYKAAISGVSLGGGKSVIIGDPRSDKSDALLRALGHFIEAMGGEYIAGQDIGTGSHDMAVLRGVTRHVSCVPRHAGGAGDPSHATAYGVTCGIRAVLEAVTGNADLAGRHVAIQGLGHVGAFVARYCHGEGARLTVCDVVEEPVRQAVEELGAAGVAPDAIYDVECDIFAPCSIGAVVNDRTLDRFRCAGIAGAANNVLAEPRHGTALMKRGIAYAPDYLVNSGGLIRCQEEVLGAPTDDARIFEKVSQIQGQTRTVLRVAEERGIGSEEAANRMAEERLHEARQGGKAWSPLRNARPA
ncbi:MAG: Glu/Leu/Phe/Val dehydrogenase dimerization domain-containing protein [Gemmatimonadales bacterium]